MRLLLPFDQLEDGHPAFDLLWPSFQQPAQLGPQLVTFSASVSLQGFLVQSQELRVLPLRPLPSLVVRDEHSVDSLPDLYCAALDARDILNLGPIAAEDFVAD